ncbi:MAG: uridine kinase [Oscillospiraceae bacterium]|nr:uridine kinase [Oscillospiraceae bacterium]
MKREFERFLSYIDDLIRTRERVIVAIEGNSGAGKSTLAETLRQKYEKYDCTVIHTDDFFLQEKQRTEKRLSEPGGNIDYERFADEVIAPLLSGESFGYHKYDCGANKLGELITVQPSRLVIIEGVYSTHPKFGEVYDLKAFISIRKEEQYKRLQKRNPDLFERFVKEWIPMEDIYFESFNIKQNCQLYININEG